MFSFHITRYLHIDDNVSMSWYGREYLPSFRVVLSISLDFDEKLFSVLNKKM